MELKLLADKLVLKVGQTIHGPDYSVMFKAPEGRELHVGRIFYGPTARAGTDGEPWFWSVEFHQRRGRTEPHQGICEGEALAKEQWRKCWDSADVPINWPPALRS